MKLFGEQHATTADSYHSIGVTHYQMKDYVSVPQPHQEPVNTGLKLHGEQQATTALSYDWIRIIEHEMEDYVWIFNRSNKQLT